jgi:hypothetical protein
MALFIMLLMWELLCFFTIREPRKVFIFARILKSGSEAVVKLILLTLFSSINFAHTVKKLGVSI